MAGYISSHNISARLVIAYCLDWLVIILLAGGGAVLTFITGFHRPFSLTDLAISYPQKPDIISIGFAGVLAVLIPALLILLLSIVPPHPPLPLGTARSVLWRRKFWDANVGLMGFGFSVAGTLLVTAGLKDLVGKPRPDLLARCNPDFSKITDFKVGGFGTSLTSEASSLVTSGICQETSKKLLDDGFASFPSGHSSISWAGLLYFTLWLCWRYSIVVPYLRHLQNNYTDLNELHHSRERQAAPPLWQTVLALVPVGTALFICGSRYADFHHAGIDIVAGSIIGILFAIAGFRMYHLPSSRGMRLTWGARKMHRAFMAGAGGKDVEFDSEEGNRPWHGLRDENNMDARLVRPPNNYGEELTTYPSSVHSNRPPPEGNYYPGRH